MTTGMNVSPLVNIHTHRLNNDGAVQIVSIDLSDAINSETINCTKNNAVSIGLHPLFISETNSFDPEHFHSFIQRFPVAAIGEIGLDKQSPVTIERQMELFRQQAAFAREHQLPVIIHCVGRWNELELLFKERQPGDSEWIIHGFRKIHLAEKFLNLGATLSIGAALSYDEQLQQCVKDLPLERLFLETDDADTNLEALYMQLASLKSLSLPTVKERLYQHYLDAFHHGKLA